MSTAFQSTAFQKNAFQIDLSSITVDKRDTFEHTPYQWKKYRDRLLALSEASGKFLENKYFKEDVIEQIEELEALDEEVKTQVLVEMQPDMTLFYQALQTRLTSEITKFYELKVAQEEDDDITTMLLSGGL